MTKPDNARLNNASFAHWANITFKLILLALVLLWVIFPPHHSAQSGLQSDMRETRNEATSIKRG